MTCPPGTGCARRPDCQDSYCPGRPIADCATTLHTRSGGAHIDGMAGTAHHGPSASASRILPFDARHSAADTEARFWLPADAVTTGRPARSLLTRLEDWLDAISFRAWLWMTVTLTLSAIGTGLLAGHISDIGIGNVLALLAGGAR